MCCNNVQSSGQPINFSTQLGFSCPPSAAITAWSSLSFDRSCPSRRVKDAGDDPLLIEATGVGHAFAAAGSPFLGLLVSKFPRFSASLAFGVGK